MAQKNIDCPDGCAPDKVNIETNPKTLRWIYKPKDTGEIRNITGLPSPPFSGGHRDGPDYVMQYEGAPEGKEWPYGIDSDPACPTPPTSSDEDVDVPPRLTSGP